MNENSSADYETLIDCRATLSEGKASVTCYCRKCKTLLAVYEREQFDCNNLVMTKTGLSVQQLEMLKSWEQHACKKANEAN